MKKILVVESSPMGERSISRRLTKDIVDGLLKKHPGSTVVVRDLAAHPLPHLSAEHLAAFFTPADQRDASQRETVRASDAAIDELLAADILVVGAPMWNFGVPSGLKAWIDHVARAGRTFTYSAAGPKGLATGKKAYVAAASGGVYTHGPSQTYDFVTPYLRALLGFLGVTDVSFIRAEGLAIPEKKETAYEHARREVEALLA